MYQSMTYYQMIKLINQSRDDIGQSIAGKRLPSRISICKNKSIQTLTNAYQPCQTALIELAQANGVDPNSLFENPDTRDQAQDLLMQKEDVDIDTFPAELLDQCGNGIFDALTDAEIGHLMWLIE